MFLLKDHKTYQLNQYAKLKLISPLTNREENMFLSNTFDL